jgi:DNA-binding CsgD family transcriptional regulator/sugar lactone lactonase YvrE
MGTSSVGNGPIRLSRRELEIARLVAEGLTNREIAARLFLSERTVDGHLEHVREKLGVNTRAQIATWVARQGDASPAPVAAAAPAPQTVSRPSRVLRRRWLIAAAAVLVLVEAAVVLQLQGPQGPTIVTVAGSSPVTERSVGSFSGEGGRPTAAVMSLPSDVATSRDGSIYIADYRNQAIRRVADGRIVTWAGRGDNDLETGKFGPSVQIGHASNIAVDPNGRPFVLTNWNRKLEVWTIEPERTMTLVVIVGPSRTQFGLFWPPPVGGLAVGSKATLYISDRSANKIYRYSLSDQSLKVVAGTGQAGYSNDGAAATGAMLDRPGGLAVDGQGNLYIADSGNNRIRKVDTSGIITTVAGGGGKYYGDSGDGGPATKARLSFPFGVAVARDGTIYIADTGNNRLREVTPSGIIRALAGTGIAGFAGDGGAALSADLSAPEGIALDGKGNLFVADTANLRVREVIGVNP